MFPAIAETPVGAPGLVTTGAVVVVVTGGVVVVVTGGVVVVVTGGVVVVVTGGAGGGSICVQAPVAGSIVIVVAL